MKYIVNYIKEGIKIGSNTKVNNFNYSEEEMRDDYNNVSYAIEKKEKQHYARKYGIESNKIHEIELRISELLRENRKNKKEFDNKDVIDFIRLNLPEKYDKLKEYFDKETKEFLNFYYKYYEEKIKKISKLPTSRLSVSDKYLLKRFNQIKQYLKEEYNEVFK